MRQYLIPAAIGACLVGPGMAQQAGQSTPYRVTIPIEEQVNPGNGTSTPYYQPPADYDTRRLGITGAPTSASAAHKEDATANRDGQPGQIQVYPGIPGRASGASDVASNQTRYMCLPSYGEKSLTSGGGMGSNPNQCVWKGPEQVRSCDCSTFYYKNVHTLSMPGFSPSDYEEAQRGSSCVSYSYYQASYCDKYSCYTYSVPYCPNGGYN